MLLLVITITTGSKAYENRSCKLLINTKASFPLGSLLA